MNIRAVSSSLQLQLTNLSLGLHHPIRSFATLCIIYEITPLLCRRYKLFGMLGMLICKYYKCIAKGLNLLE